MPQPLSAQATARRIIWLLVAINLSVPAFVLIQRKGDGLSDALNIAVGWITAAMITAVFLAMSRARLTASEGKISRGLLVKAAGLVFLSGLITTVTISASPSASFVQLAQSNLPLSEIRPERKRLVVELIRRDIAATTESSRLARGMKPISPALYSVESFASKEVMESASLQLKKAYDADLAYSAALYQARQDFRRKMTDVDPSYLRDFDAKMHDRDAMDAVLLATEKNWATSSFNLYSYAIANVAHISIDKTDRLHISDLDVRKDFLRQLGDCRALQLTLDDQREKDADDRNRVKDALESD